MRGETAGVTEPVAAADVRSLLGLLRVLCRPVLPKLRSERVPEGKQQTGGSGVGVGWGWLSPRTGPSGCSNPVPWGIGSNALAELFETRRGALEATHIPALLASPTTSPSPLCAHRYEEAGAETAVLPSEHEGKLSVELTRTCGDW